MHDDIRVTMRAMMPTPQGVGVFLSDGAKVIAIFVDACVAGAIALIARGERSPRPMTHDLMVNTLTGLGARLNKVVIHDLKDGTFYARLHVRQENELGKHLVEIDARPSDSIALALSVKCPIFVSRAVWEQAEDMAWALEKAEREAQSQPPDAPPSEDAGTADGGTEPQEPRL